MSGQGRGSGGGWGGDTVLVKEQSASRFIREEGRFMMRAIDHEVAVKM